MKDYIEQAEKNEIELISNGNCQFCGSNVERGVYECMELFSLGFESLDYSKHENHFFRFLSVDAHTLQHPEIHGRWNNHFHLTRLHLILKYEVQWTYRLSPMLSDCLNVYKINRQDEYLEPPEIGRRGDITVLDVASNGQNEEKCKEWIQQWARKVYVAWTAHHDTVDFIATKFLNT